MYPARQGLAAELNLLLRQPSPVCIYTMLIIK